jgi:probable HAF family extracellular repeat protein
MHRSLLLAVLSLGALHSPLVAAQDASYRFTQIEVPGAKMTHAFGINTAGQIVGTFSDATGVDRVFLKDGETFLPICSSLIPSRHRLDYIPAVQLAFSENRGAFPLTLSENRLRFGENNLITSGAACIN